MSKTQTQWQIATGPDFDDWYGPNYTGDKASASILIHENGEVVGMAIEVFDGYSSISETLKSRANLIAAAPELLEALHAMIKFAEFAIKWREPPRTGDGSLMQARAAIKKATGA